MTIHRRLSNTLVMILLLIGAVVPVFADRGGDDNRDNVLRENQGRDKNDRDKGRADKDSQDRHRREETRRDYPRSHPPGYVLDNRYRHNHYYPPRGHAVPVLPSGHRVVRYNGQPYYYHGGVWYRPSGTRFIVVLPPTGLVVPFLPSFYTTIWFSGRPYYYAAGVYYVWRPEFSGYAVAEAPAAADVSVQSETPDQLYIYKKQGQSEQQQANDRYQCHRWATDQTGFDPSQPGGELSESQLNSKRADYQRAMKACLEARGYSVQ